MTQRRTSLFEPADQTRQKTLMTLEKCGELESHLISGFSRSIGKTDNTQILRPRSSANRKDQTSMVILRRVRLGHQWSESRKATVRWLFLMASHWPPKSVPSEQVCGMLKAPAAAGSGRTWLCLPDLRRRTRKFNGEPRASLAALLIAVGMPFSILFVLL
jgi:hypothetical protein